VSRSVVSIVVGAACAAAACGDSSAPAPRTNAPLVGQPDPRPVLPPSTRDAAGDPPAFPPGTRSLRLTKTIAVRYEPGDAAKQIGTIAQDTRVRWTATRTARGCAKPWIEIEPRGWVCGEYVEPATRLASGVELPRLDRGEVVPGVYGKVSQAGASTYTLVKDPKAKPIEDDDRAKPVSSPDEVDNGGEGSGSGAGSGSGSALSLPPDPRKVVLGKPLVGSVNVRKYGEVFAGGKIYWKISKQPEEYVLRSVVREHKPSDYGGVRLGDDTGWSLPIGFVYPRYGGRTVYTRYKQKGGGVYRQLVVRTAVPILEAGRDASGKITAYRIGETEWIDAASLRVVDAAEPPKLIDPGERWLDVDADRQTLVAYEGTTPVYATLISSGAKDTPTEPGIYRMWKKMMEADMRDLQSEDPYSVATVPWTQFFYPDDGLAVHAAYWHDKFGTARSHGCINLSPRDARWLYFWTDPWVPPGWTMTAGLVEAPGSIVRIRSKAVPDPPLRGYARRVHEDRQARSGLPQ
jgi:hypothetical protein